MQGPGRAMPRIGEFPTVGTFFCQRVAEKNIFH
jgi:hypothetical protein